MAMNRPVGAAEAPLAPKLASPRSELAALQTEVGMSRPAGPVVEIQKVKNDVRLPSHALLEAQLPTAGAPSAAPRADGPPRSVATQWSAAARVISAVLADLEAESAPVRGTAPLWPASRQTPAVPVLAAALAQTVSGSGLFYESHLLEFATGRRTLAQLAQEPQVRLTQQQPLPEQLLLPRSSAAAAATQPGQAAPAPSFAADPLAAAGQRLPAVGQPMPGPSAAAPSAVTGAPGAPGPGLSDAGATGAASPALAASPSSQAAQAFAALQPMASAGLPGLARAARDEEGAAGAASSRAALPGAGAAELIHPQTATLVHQQLDLLATAVFRWSGQAWPDVPMQWSVQEETEQQPSDAQHEGSEERPRRWTTTVSLTLPMLGAVDLRLSLTGELVQAQLAASEPQTLTRLRSGGSELAPRLEAAGLHLQELQFSAMDPKTEQPA